MSRFRDAFESQMSAERKVHARYGRPATVGRIAAVEAGIGVQIPADLRELYTEFDGLWFDELNRDTPPDDDTEWYEVLPLSLLVPARNVLVRLYGRAARDRLVEQYGTVEEEAYDGFERQLSRCVAFSLSEQGASFKFMTDESAWGIAAGQVGGWSHDGGAYNAACSLDEHLAEIGELRSRGM